MNCRKYTLGIKYSDFFYQKCIFRKICKKGELQLFTKNELQQKSVNKSQDSVLLLKCISIGQLNHLNAFFHNCILCIALYLHVTNFMSLHNLYLIIKSLKLLLN